VQKTYIEFIVDVGVRLNHVNLIFVFALFFMLSLIQSPKITQRL